MKTNAKRNLIAAGLIAIGQGSALAQEQLVLEEVLVVATKRTASLQDIPLAVSAITEEALRDQQINTVEDLTRLVPSLNKQSGNSFNIRGIGTQAPGPLVAFSGR